MTDREREGEYVQQAAEDGEAVGVPGEPPQTAPAAAGAPVDAEAAMGALAEAFAERFAQAAGHLLGAPFHARPVGVTAQSLGQFLAGVETATCCCALRRSPARRDDEAAGSQPPTGWVELDREFSFVCIERLLGGPADQAYLPDRSLTAIERRLLRRVLVLSTESLRGVWPQRPAWQFELAEGWGGQPPAGGVQEQPAVTARFEVALAAQVGMMRLCLPVGLLAGFGAPARRPVARNAGPIELSVALPDIVAPADELADLAPGDIIATDTPVEGEVLVRLAGIPKFAARLGTSGNKRAVTLTRKIGAAKQASEAS